MASYIAGGAKFIDKAAQYLLILLVLKTISDLFYLAFNDWVAFLYHFVPTGKSQLFI